MLICPLCGEKLLLNEKSYTCNNKHCFDIARQGYVNLLPVQNKHSLHPGDTKEMLCARREFLNGGTYKPICDSVIEQAHKYLINGHNITLLDVGCGEGYYLKAFKDILKPEGTVGADISKDGVKMACARDRAILWLVATASHLPIEAESVDMLTAMFSLFMEDEYARVLKSGGIAVEVIAANEHLKELKEIIYEEVFEQNKQPCKLKSDKFVVLNCEQRRFEFTLKNAELRNLLMMTPHFWRIKEENREKLLLTEGLKLTANYFVRTLRKI